MGLWEERRNTRWLGFLSFLEDSQCFHSYSVAMVALEMLIIFLFIKFKNFLVVMSQFLKLHVTFNIV